MAKVSKATSGKVDISFIDSVKFVLESAKYPTVDDVKDLTIDVTKITVVLGVTSLLARLIFSIV